MSTHIRCFACRGFFDIKQAACPDCGQLRRGYSSHLYTAALNNHLYGMAEQADRTLASENAIQSGDPRAPVPQWCRDAAAEMRRNGTLDIAAAHLQ